VRERERESVCVCKLLHFVCDSKAKVTVTHGVSNETLKTSIKTHNTQEREKERGKESVRVWVCVCER